MSKNNILMYRDSDGIIKFKGEIRYREPHIKEVIIDGEKYTNTSTVNKVVTVEEMRSDEWMGFHFKTYDYDLKGFGSILKIEDNSVFYSNLSELCNMDGDFKYVGSSENQYVNRLLKAFKYGFVNPVVKNICTGRIEHFNEYTTWSYIMHYLEVEICIYEYGWNNGLFVSVSLEDFITKFNHNETDDRLIDLFMKKGINLKSKNDFNKIQSLIKNKISYETSKQ